MQHQAFSFGGSLWSEYPAWETIEEPETMTGPRLRPRTQRRLPLPLPRPLRQRLRTSASPPARRPTAQTQPDLPVFSVITCLLVRPGGPPAARWLSGTGRMYGVLIRWIDAIAHVIITARSLWQMKDGNTLGRRTGETKQYKFSVPAALSSPDSSAAARATHEDGSEMSFVNNYIYEEETGIVHYQGTRAALAAQEQPPSAIRGVSPEKRQTHEYSIVTQATALSSATTLATESCVSNMVKWHINRGSWKFALRVNINKGHNNNGEKGECCDF